MGLNLHDIKILTFIYDRLIKENKNCDYMIFFKEVIDKLTRFEQ